MIEKVTVHADKRFRSGCDTLDQALSPDRLTRNSLKHAPAPCELSASSQTIFIQIELRLILKKGLLSHVHHPLSRQAGVARWRNACLEVDVHSTSHRLRKCLNRPTHDIDRAPFANDVACEGFGFLVVVKNSCVSLVANHGGTSVTIFEEHAGGNLGVDVESVFHGLSAEIHEQSGWSTTIESDGAAERGRTRPAFTGTVRESNSSGKPVVHADWSRR